MTTDDLLENTQNNELMKFLGVEIVEASAERVVMTMPVTPKVHQYVGIMNGGVSLYLFETAASIGVEPACAIGPRPASPRLRVAAYCSRLSSSSLQWS